MRCDCGTKLRTLDTRDHWHHSAERIVKAKAKEVLTVTKNYKWRRKKCPNCKKVYHTVELRVEDIRKLAQ